MAVTSRQKTNRTQSARADLKRQRTEYAALVQLSLASMAIRSFGIDLSIISGPARGGATVTFARHTAMYLAVLEGRLTLTEVGHQFTRDRRAVAYGIARLEERRDVEPAFDDGMNELTGQFRQRLDDLLAYHRITDTAGAA